MEPLAYILATSAPREWAAIACAASCLLSLAHTWDEASGSDGPFWAYYERHFGFGGIGDARGAMLFAGLCLTLFALAAWGHLFGSAFALGALVGARLGDWSLSHVGLRLRFEGPNPGLPTSWLYPVEAAVTVCALSVSWWGLAVGFGAFALFWSGSFAARWYGLASGLLFVIPKRAKQ